jgi:beta-lactamase superfamily II metal-dependent hydrolase
MNQRRNQSIGLAGLLGLLLMFAGGCTQLGLGGGSKKSLDIYWIDVEGGAATLIVTPAGESVLIDTGNPGGRDSARIILAAKQAGLTHLDHLITTHYHRDHFGGAPEVATAIPISNLHDSADENPSRDKPTPEYLAMKVGTRTLIKPGDTIALKQARGPTLQIKCLVARKQMIDPPAGAKQNPYGADVPGKPIDLTDNANSIVTLLSFGDFRFYDGGDLTWNVEKDLVSPINRVGTVDVYQVTHHGLDQSNHPALVMGLEPTVAIMNNGSTKGCEPATFATLKGTKSIQDIWQVHKNLREDGATNNVRDEFIANMERDCQGHGIKMSVAPDAKTYTVSIPHTSFSKTYQTRKHD